MPHGGKEMIGSHVAISLRALTKGPVTLGENPFASDQRQHGIADPAAFLDMLRVCRVVVQGGIFGPAAPGRQAWIQEGPAAIKPLWFASLVRPSGSEVALRNRGWEGSSASGADAFRSATSERGARTREKGRNYFTLSIRITWRDISFDPSPAAGALPTNSPYRNSRS